MTQKSKSTRIDVVDALRGFAVMAIMLLHCLERFNLYIFPDKAALPSWLVKSDSFIWDSSFFLFGGKAYAIFALLFGLTFHLQNSRQQKLGNDFGYTYLWRMVLMVGFAFINAIFFPGDVLLLFAFVGCMLFFVRNWSTKAIFITSLVMLMQPIELIQYVISLTGVEFTTIEEAVRPIVRDNSKELKLIIQDKNLISTLWSNFTNGQFFSFFWAIGNGRWIQTLGLFLMGMTLGRINMFEDSEANRLQWFRVLVIGGMVFIPLYFLDEASKFIFSGQDMHTITNAVSMWRNLAFTAILVSAFVLLYQGAFRVVLSRLIPYGKMSLSNYIGQSVIGFILFFPVTMNISPIIPNTYALLLGIVLFIAQLHFCKWWLKSHKQGPLESLWHRGTYVFQRKKTTNNKVDQKVAV